MSSEKKTSELSWQARVTLAQSLDHVASDGGFLSRLEMVIARRDLRREMRKRDQQPNKVLKKAKKSEQQQTKKESFQNKYGVMDQDKKSSNLPAVRKKEAVEPEIVDDDSSGEESFSPTTKTSFERIQEIEDPQFFLASFATPEAKTAFMANTKNLVQAGSAIPLYTQGVGSLDKTVAYIINSTAKTELINRSQQVPKMIIDASKFFNQDRPFTGLKISKELVSAISNQTAQLINELNQTWKNITVGASDAGRVPALRMSSDIPLKYMRFLDTQHKTYNYYIGDDPAGAGQEGAVFVLAHEDEIKLFLETMKRFGPPSANFFSDLYETSDIDSEFKDFEPNDLKPQNALVLVAKNKFDLQAEVYDEHGETIDPEDLEDSQIGSKPIDLKTTQLEQLHAFAAEYLGNKERPGTFMKMRLYTGDNVVHINKNKNMVILWGSRSPIKANKKTVLEKLPFVKDAIFTFSK